MEVLKEEYKVEEGLNLVNNPSSDSPFIGYYFTSLKNEDTCSRTILSPSFELNVEMSDKIKKMMEKKGQPP